MRIKRVRFDYKVAEVLEFPSVIVVRLEIPPKTIYNNNVFGIDSCGKIKWQVLKPFAAEVEDDPFVGLTRDGKKLFVNDWTGHRYQIDLETGAILSKKFVK